MTAKPSIDLLGVLRKVGMDQDVDFLREGVRVLSQALMEAEVSAQLGAERHERTPERSGQRNGYRERQWDTRVGTIDLQVPRVRDGRYFPSLLEPRKRAERALAAVVQERGAGAAGASAQRDAHRRCARACHAGAGWPPPCLSARRIIVADESVAMTVAVPRDAGAGIRSISRGDRTGRE
jgi:hypothetical protein